LFSAELLTCFSSSIIFRHGDPVADARLPERPDQPEPKRVQVGPDTTPDVQPVHLPWPVSKWRSTSHAGGSVGSSLGLLQEHQARQLVQLCTCRKECVTLQEETWGTCQVFGLFWFYLELFLLDIYDWKWKMGNDTILFTGDQKGVLLKISNFVLYEHLL